jgi:hypothetical protein
LRYSFYERLYGLYQEAFRKDPPAAGANLIRFDDRREKLAQ